ncbi:hypothetical protein N2152v2_006619 [Parachlorella kessleri]
MAATEVPAAAVAIHVPQERWDEEAQPSKDVTACYQSAELSSKVALLSWSNLTVKVKDVKGNSRLILKGVDGFVEPRHMLAIMGPSGCGKTTLLDTLSGRLGRAAESSGEIRVNGHKSSISYGRSAYVTQDEVLIGTLTVEETIRFAAQLRLPATLSAVQRGEVVENVLREMGLDGARNTYIGNWHLRGVSGGQRRRVSIGCELVTSPTLMFLDEPTSGLDSASAFYVMDSVRQLAEHCRTIVAVIHQPSSEVFGLFDKLCLLSDGEVVYFGDARRTLDMFNAAGLPCPPLRNPADHFLHCINRDFADSGEVERNVQALVKTYTGSRVYQEVKQRVAAVAAHPGQRYEISTALPPWLRQTSVLTHRTFLNNLRNVGVFWVRLAMYIMLCLGLAFIYFQLGDSWKDVFSRAALLFFVVAFLTFMSIAGFPAFAEDMKVFIRERLNGYYGVSVFTVANTLASLPFIFLIAVVSTCCVYFIAHLRYNAGAVWYFILTLFAALTVVESLMMAIAPVVPHYLMGIAAGAGILGFFMLVCGFFQPLGSLPKPILRYPLTYISFHTYAFNGMMKNEFPPDSTWECPCSAVPPPWTCPDCVFTGTDVLDYYEMNLLNIPKWPNFVILLGWALFYRAAFYLTLKWKEWRSK